VNNLIKMGVKGAEDLARCSLPAESSNISSSNVLLMAVTDGVSVTETPWLKRGSVWYASAPSNDMREDYGFASVLGVGTTLSACGAPPSARRARWGKEAGSPRAG